ncbi:multiple sugar transport system permease protein [Ardenticatena maritima]|uniref:Multiple sugar transport system permease protein n=2 Tax=Ardenticatena maritima TaxID=872965 RepID=A0A0M8K7L7_9CHLR|nr:carbohydrate ABC transporter permease [Ardenticatena maritima]GAP62129.1 multiple sugar transport system permease protein [Ardenticatena maritima]
MAAEPGTYTQTQERSPMYAKTLLPKRVREWVLNVTLTGLTILLLVAFLIPMAYGVTTALKTNNQFSEPGAPWWPARARTFEYEGEEYEVYLVPIDGEIKHMALYKKGRKTSLLIDIEHPEQGPIEWEGNWRQLERDWEFAPQWQNFKRAWDTIDFPLLLRNTLMYAGITTFGAVMSAAVVAYGFARFRIPGKQILFMLMLSTVILPGAVTLIPTYYVFLKIGWVGTWLPLIVPAFFSWGTNVFLLRQFFLTIPRDLDEAAMIDGANPLRIFLSILLPMSKPALTAVALFHFFWAWNDFFGPLIYLAGHPEKFPITVGLTQFNNLYSQSTNLIQAASLISAVIPLLVFFFAQRIFMQGVVITGVEK